MGAVIVRGIFAPVAVMLLLMSSPVSGIELKIHHPLPTSSTVHQQVLLPWCATLEKESGGGLSCRIFPAMQLGGAVTQLIDQVEDGVVDIIWTLPGFSPGRFPRTEVFELPFMIRDAESASRALWEYVQRYDMDEFAGMKPLALHVHGGGVFHSVKRPIKGRRHLRGMKVRAPTRQTTRFMSILGATPVGMPAPQVPEALTKGVIDATLLPYEVMPALKVNELTQFHSEPAPDQPRIYTSVFVLGMNKAAYEKLAPELRKIIDDNSGVELSSRMGRIFGEAEIANRKLLSDASINTIAATEIAQWRKLAQPIIDGWVSDVTSGGVDGKALLEAARRLISSYERAAAPE